jgi:tetratricopeptide (TPR) repeat protein
MVFRLITFLIGLACPLCLAVLPADAVDNGASGESMSQTVYQLLKTGEGEKALALLEIATERFPNDPDVIGIRGVVAALAGQNEAALVLLENAVVWKQDNPLVNYNLGNLLVQSEMVADWIRGKQLLMDVMDCGDIDLVERAGLTLLVNLRIPLLPEEALAIHEQLDALGVFRPDNPRLSEVARMAIRERMKERPQPDNIVVESGDTTWPVDWDASYLQARNNDQFSRIKDLGLLALGEGQNDKAYTALLYVFFAGVPLSGDELGELLELSRTQGSLLETVRVAEGRMRQSPGNLFFINDFLYYRFLAEENVEQTLISAKRQLDAYPQDQSVRLTYALGLLRSGGIKEARGLFEEAPIDFSESGLRGRLIYTVVLAAFGNDVVADALRETIDSEALIPAEEKLLEAF